MSLYNGAERQLIERQAVRAIIITPEKEVLLMRIQNPESKETFWICPGGGLQGEENPESALVRELAEEVGLKDFVAHHIVHRRHHTFNWKDKRISQHEVFFAVQTAKFNPVISDPVEVEVLQEFRWWPLSEMASIPDPITPRSLKNIVEDYLVHGPPSNELGVDTRVD